MAEPDKPALDGKRPAGPWLTEIDAALKREDTWRKRGKKVVERYRDEREKNSTTSKVNILWSNTEVLKAALYPRTSKPDVRRRFTDAKKGNRAAKIAAEVLERSLSYCIDVYDIDTPIDAVIEDMLLPGRGQAWVSYDPEIEEVGPADPPSDEAKEESEDEPKAEARIVGQKLITEYVYWEDFTHGLSRTWRDCPWVARRHLMRQKQFEAKFPDQRKDIRAEASMTTSGEMGGEAFVEIWEIWARDGKERLYVGRGYTDILQADADPLGLSDFFPCPEPIYSVTTTDTRMPVPEFVQYQDQASELDNISTRIVRLIEQMRWRGVYDATVDQDGTTLKALETADDGTLLPHENFAGLREKGGIDGAIGFIPIDRIYPIVAQLHTQRQALVQEIYQITGISDIIRGSTDPRETKGAQQLKAQFGSMRMQKRQGRVQKFIRDIYRIKSEIIAEHFTAETMAEMTGFELPSMEEQNQIKAQIAAAQAQQQAPPMPGAPMPPPAAPPPSPDMLAKANGPTWDEVVEILRSDKLRSYRVDVETDATAMVDAEAEKQSRLEFMAAFEKMIAGAAQAAMTAPMMLPLIKEATLFAMRTYKPGKALEESVETAFDELQKNPPQPPEQADPNAGKAEAEAAKLALETQRLQADVQGKQADLALQAKKTDGELALKQAELALKQQEAMAAANAPGEAPPPVDETPMLKLGLDAKKIDADIHFKDRELALKEREMAIKEAELQLKAADAQRADQSAMEAGEVARGETEVSSKTGATLDAIMQLVQGMAEGQQAMVTAMTAPKRVVRDKGGKVVGVEAALQ